MNMEMTCDPTRITPLSCTSSDPFKFSAPFGMPNVPLFKREGCFEPPTCMPTMQQEIFNYGFASSAWATSELTTWGSTTLSGSSGARLVGGSSQHGAVWRNEKIAGIQAGFLARFKFRISKNWCLFCGDDAGFAFVIQNGNALDPEGDTSSYACGSGGVELNMEGVDSVPIADFKTRLTCAGYKNMGGKSVGVVFSTKENRMYNLGLTADQPRASVSVWRDGKIQSGTASSSRREQSEAVIAYSQVYEDYGDGGERTAVGLVYVRNSCWTMSESSPRAHYLPQSPSIPSLYLYRSVYHNRRSATTQCGGSSTSRSTTSSSSTPPSTSRARASTSATTPGSGLRAERSSRSTLTLAHFPSRGRRRTCRNRSSPGVGLRWRWP